MRSTFIRVFAVMLAVAVVASCDSATTPCTGVSCSTGGTGGTGGTPKGADTTSPDLVIDTPFVNQTYNVGDTIRVTGRVQDYVNLSTVTISGVTITGDTTLGTATETPRYKEVTINYSGNAVNAIRRGIVPLTPLDTVPGTMYLRVTATDAAGNSRLVTVPVRIVSGPRVIIIAPKGDSIPAGGPMTVIAAGLQSAGLDSIIVHVSSGTGFPTPLVDSAKKSSAGKAADTLTATFKVPSNAPARGLITVDVTVRDALGQYGKKSITVPICGGCGQRAPLVTQVVPPRVEYSNGIRVTATGNAIAWLGLIVSDSNDTPASMTRDSVPVPTTAQGAPSNATDTIPIFPASMSDSLKLLQQGRRIRIRSFARDSAGRIGYSVLSGTATPVTTFASAAFDTSIVAYGRTFSLAAARPGVIGDLAVDPVRGNVILSNTSYNLLEVWNDASKSYLNPVPVGSLPWGLFVSNNPDTLLVANSGATTVSRVYLGTGGNTIKEDLASRIRTRNSFVYKVTYSLQNGVIRLLVEGPFSYSDRPQYLAESKAGRLYFSTRPTTTAPEGTLRWLDPSKKFADAHQLHSYVPYLSGTTEISWVVFNADSVKVIAATTASASDKLIIWDHDVDTTNPSVSAESSSPDTALMNLQAAVNTDVDMVYRLDRSQIGLTDTTFAAASGDKSWIAFGEGDTQGTKPGRIIMVNDPTAGVAPTFSPLVSVADLTENASEKVFGLAVDSVGRQVGSHGLQSYVAAVDDPFQLRLEGVYDSFDDGAGVAFDPSAIGPTTTQRDRVMFVASKSGSIEVVDVAYFNNRGTLPTKGTLYGPLRATAPLTAAEKAMGIIMKLYALTPQGLVVIDLTKKDIKDGP